MNCDCYEKAFHPVLQLLEEASGIMYYATPDYDKHLASIHEMMSSLRLKVKCIDRCWEKSPDEEIKRSSESDCQE